MENDFIHINRETARVVGFSTTAPKGKVMVRVDIEVTDSYALADLTRDLMDAKKAGEAATPRRRTLSGVDQ